MGIRQVTDSVKDAKLVVLSRSVQGEDLEKLESGAKAGDIPLVRFQGTSVALGRLCGLQFRTSTISFTSIPDSSIKSIIKDVEAESE